MYDVCTLYERVDYTWKTNQEAALQCRLFHAEHETVRAASAPERCRDKENRHDIGTVQAATEHGAHKTDVTPSEARLDRFTAEQFQQRHVVEWRTHRLCS